MWERKHSYAKVMKMKSGINGTEQSRLYLVLKQKKSVEIMILKNGLASKE